MIMSRDQNIVRNGTIKIEDLSFEEVEKFKYLGAAVTNINYTREEIKRRINMGTAYYYSVEKLLSSSLLSKNLKVRIYKTIILPVLLYGCETWTLTLREEQRLRLFENKVRLSFLSDYLQSGHFDPCKIGIDTQAQQLRRESSHEEGRRLYPHPNSQNNRVLPSTTPLTREDARESVPTAPVRRPLRRSPVVGLPLLASGQACNAAFPLHLMKQLYRCDSVAISSLVETGWTTGRHYSSNLELKSIALIKTLKCFIVHLHITTLDWEMFYLRKLWLFVFGIHNQENNTAQFYCYHEGQANRGPIEVCTFLNDYISELDSVKELHVFSDLCGGQNRNNTVFSRLFYDALSTD
ncbi:hypothetical protein ANN_12659 [Periplaneta americana]|uniref:Uncharacterized protein n=1 Tax=Periplaneta americana TaxID=6978 RepID=A0ABQ8TI71_PERAM|nr:hypothetical protein ANN_12659 [Periplaneta americana]